MDELLSGNLFFFTGVRVGFAGVASIFFIFDIPIVKWTLYFEKG